MGVWIVTSLCSTLMIAATWESRWDNVVGKMTCNAAIFGLLALWITGLVSLLAGRRIRYVDIFRMACWVSFAAFGGVIGGQPVRQYYEHEYGVWPAWIEGVVTLARFGIYAALIAIVASAFLCPIPRDPLPNHCSRYGYNLTGNTSGVCPECGGAI